MWTNFKLRMAAIYTRISLTSARASRNNGYLFHIFKCKSTRIHLMEWVFSDKARRSEIWKCVSGQNVNAIFIYLLFTLRFASCSHVYDNALSVYSLVHSRIAIRDFLPSFFSPTESSAFMHSKKADIHIRVLLLSVVGVPCHIVTWHIASNWKERRKKNIIKNELDFFSCFRYSYCQRVRDVD